MTNIQEILLKQPLLLFDGECGLCNRLVLYFLKHEKNKLVNFAPLKSPKGQAVLDYFSIDKNTDSIILIKEHSAYIKSCAVLRLARYMKGGWPLMLVLLIIPPFLRNIPYDFIAKRRIKWFGRTENCALLTKEDQQRFLKD